jgi:hypothetical protein
VISLRKGLLAWLVCLTAAAWGQQIPALRELPPDVAASRSDLVSQRAALVQERTSLHARFDQHNAECDKIDPENKDKVSACASEHAALVAELKAHIARSESFNAAVQDAPPAPSQSHPKIGTAAAVRGDVFWLTADGRKIPVGSGSPLLLDSHIVTGSGGRLQILLDDETVFTIGPNSDMVLDKFVYDPSTNTGSVSAAFIRGTFRFVTGKIARRRHEDMHVRLNVACLGIRGTDFETTVAPDGSGQIKLFSGQLEITPHAGGLLPHPAERNSSTFLLNAGHMVTFLSSGEFSSPVKIP